MTDEPGGRGTTPESSHPGRDRRKCALRQALLSVLATALVVGTAVYLSQSLAANREKRKAVKLARAELQSQLDRLESEVGQLQGEIARLRAGMATSKNVQERTVPRETVEERRAGLRPKPGWEKYFPSPKTNTLMGKSMAEVRELLGTPPDVVRVAVSDPSRNKEIWVYHPYEDDPTGVYVFFKGGRVIGSKLDEFSGFGLASFWPDPQSWYE